MLEKLRKALRITHTQLDDEIEGLVEVAKADMKLSGIVKIAEEDPMIYQAIKTYVKAEYEVDIAKSTKYRESYDLLKCHLALCSEYTEVGVDEE